jgi:hypothetical protein
VSGAALFPRTFTISPHVLRKLCAILIYSSPMPNKKGLALDGDLPAKGTHMVETISAQSLSSTISSRRLLWAGAVTALAAAAANTLMRFVAAAALQPDPAFVPLSPLTPAVFTVLGVLGAVALLAVIARLARRPLWLFQRVVLIALPLTWLPDIALLFSSPFPGVTPAAVLVLMSMHAVAVAALLTVLPSLLRE